MAHWDYGPLDGNSSSVKWRCDTKVLNCNSSSPIELPALSVHIYLSGFLFLAGYLLQSHTQNKECSILNSI